MKTEGLDIMGQRHALIAGIDHEPPCGLQVIASDSAS